MIPNIRVATAAAAIAAEAVIATRKNKNDHDRATVYSRCAICFLLHRTVKKSSIYRHSFMIEYPYKMPLLGAIGGA